jgi:SAM-dependent methyltransferase
MNTLHKQFCLVLTLFAASTTTASQIDLHTNNRRAYVGLFKPQDKQLGGIVYGNWGSRPYEYYWASQITPLQGKKVIDLGTGIPSQYNWYSYVVRVLQPAFYSGIDWDERIIPESIHARNFEMRHMNMADLKYASKAFDVAFCISTYEHIPYPIFIKSIQETHRVLKDDGLLILTLDEEWDINIEPHHFNSWNELEKSVVALGMFKPTYRTFGLPEFLELIKDYFVLVVDDAVNDPATGDIVSAKDGHIYYHRPNHDDSLLNSGGLVNSCVSYAVLKKK